MNAQNACGCTPLVPAVFENNIEAFKILLEGGGNIGELAGAMSLVHFIVWFGSVDFFPLLTEFAYQGRLEETDVRAVYVGPHVRQDMIDCFKYARS
ncbi:hypothetical protein M011DRAFT_432769 [Sporormia fimetaria CBS 119925]|uniref:Uncharacterized protein n=1 Tax=Sporormia fimetaria CBS 119925 TaxID=1340428 RepID=A0A6A6UZ03_9PLEO|nr:hypothetical protein M011DRAFT_432769 [Sporormia fimetaria CBS 119925]